MSSSDPSAWVVHKFGGSSVADADCFKRVAKILDELPPGPLGVVLSACRGVTDALLNLVARAEAQDDAYRGELDAIRARHLKIAETVLSPDAAKLYMSGFDRDRHDIEGILHTVKLTRSAATNVRDLIAGYGEIWSTKLFREFYAASNQRPGEVRWVDARQCVVVEWGPLGPAVQWEESRKRTKALVGAGADGKGFKGTLIITGFIASKPNGVQTTLGRNGSDFSGSIFGSLLDSKEIHIWTDVDGVLSADPRRVPDAKVIDALSYNEAMELAYFGAKVIHPQTMAPAVGRGIPIWIRNTFAPHIQGSLISAKPDSKLPVKGITSIENIAMVNVEGAGMIGVPGTAHRLFGALREEGISVILISQGSSEHSICCAIPGTEAERASRVVTAAFDREIKEGQIQSIQIDKDLAILAVVGDGMAGLPGVSGKVFNALGSAGVNVHAIAQGASERNISVVVDQKDATRALRAVHSGFYLSPHTISIGLIGPGTVGKVLLEQIASETARLSASKLDLRVRGILSSRKMLLSEQGVDLANWKASLDASASPADIAKFVDHLHVDHLPHTVIIDCTADEHVAKHYADWLRAGIHVVTPNKKANSGPLEYYDSLKEARRQGGSAYFYEATVGAGLPVVSTLRDLRETGDKITSVEGIFSGTLAYLFNVYDGKTPFSGIVKDAKDKGYTEPDPRDDLSGTDFVRKVIILGREMGLRLEMKDVQVESLIPAGLEKGSIDDFLNGLPKYDGEMKKRFDAAASRGKVLRYMGRLTADGKASVGVVELDRSHAFANIALTDNVVRYATSRYNSNPLIVQGPGAGPAVTAAGVFADLLRVCSGLGASL